MTRVIGERYEEIRELGHGGMAEVLLVRDRLLDREVALKLLYKHLTKDREGRERFLREAKATAGLRHANIVEVYDCAAADSDELYIVTEFIEGTTLRAFVDGRPGGPPAPEVGAMIVAEVLRGLELAHSVGIIHRDIKPENVMIRGDGRVKLMDFGIARIADLESFTRTDMLIGSPLYMAPEQIEEGEVDSRSDLFSAGILLYFATTGHLPFAGESAPKVMRRICEGDYQLPELRCPEVVGPLARIIRRSMTVDPDDRYQSAEEFRHALEAYLADHLLEDVPGELRSFFDQPEEWSTAYRERLLPALLARGRRHYRARREGPGLDCYNRVLAMDPGNREVMASLRRSAQRQRVRRLVPRVALVASALVALVVLASLAPAWLARLGADRPLGWGSIGRRLRAEAPVYPSHPRRAALGSVGAPTTRRGVEARLAPVQPIRKPVRIAEAIMRGRPQVPVRIIASPPAVEVSVDGVTRSRKELAALPLTIGTHELRLRHPSESRCLPTTQTLEVRPDDQGRTVRIAIRVKAARIVVKGAPRGVVFVDGVRKGMTNESLILPMPPGRLDARQVRLRVRWKDGEARRLVRVAPGEEAVVNVEPS